MLNTINDIISNTLNILKITGNLLDVYHNLDIRQFPEYAEIIIDETLDEAIWIIDEINLMKGHLGA